MITLREELLLEVEKGKAGKNSGIPIGYKRMSDLLEIDKKTMYTVGAETGVGKSTIVQDAFIIRPLLWYYENKHKKDVKLSIIYFGMEGDRVAITTRWISRIIFENEGLLIPSKKMRGKYRDKDGNIVLMNTEEEEMVDRYSKILDVWESEDSLKFYSGSKNPSGISKYIEMFARKHGTITERVQKNKEETTLDDVLATKSYKPHHPNHIVLIITDHISILLPEREAGEGKTKMNIDKFSRTMREAKDIYEFSPVIVQQLNRNLSDVTRQKLGDLKPKLSDFADSSATSHDSEIMLALHDPYRHGDVKAELGYDLTRLRDEKGDTYYRSLYILKSRHGTSNMAIQMALHPQTGKMMSLPRSSDITDQLYQDVITGKYFLE